MNTESKKLQIIEGFTPGPWRVGDNSESCQVSIEQAVGPEKYVALVDFQTFQNEQEANARLIAAAPDLYHIAHEQLEELEAAKAVIRNLVAAMNYAVSEGCVDHLDCAMDKGASWYAAQAAAAPFLKD